MFVATRRKYHLWPHTARDSNIYRFRTYRFAERVYLSWTDTTVKGTSKYCWRLLQDKDCINTPEILRILISFTVLRDKHYWKILVIMQHLRHTIVVVLWVTCEWKISMRMREKNREKYANSFLNTFVHNTNVGTTVLSGTIYCADTKLSRRTVTNVLGWLFYRIPSQTTPPTLAMRVP